MSKRWLLLVVMLSGCSYSTHYVVPNRGVYPQNDANSVAVTSMQKIPQPHKVLGLVAVSVWGGGEDARAAVQREAAQIGANLVVDFQVHRSIGGTSASGVAVLLHQ